jgi:hypothetical protein
MSEEFVSSCRVPAYEAFLRSSHLVPVYQWERRFLQHVQNQRVTRWVLKAPDHAYALEALFSVFPDAVIIQTHRDPLQVLKSSIHLNWVLRGLYGRPDDPIQLAAREARVLAGMTDRIIRFDLLDDRAEDAVDRRVVGRIDRSDPGRLQPLPRRRLAWLRRFSIPLI